MEQIIRILKLALCGLTSLAATAGGIDLMIQSDGSGLQIPMELLEGTPFSSYFIPGLSLLILIGLFGWLTLYYEIKKIRSSIFNLRGFGMMLILWLTIELIINPDFYLPSMHISFYAIALLLILTPSYQTADS